MTTSLSLGSSNFVIPPLSSSIFPTGRPSNLRDLGLAMSTGVGWASSGTVRSLDCSSWLSYPGRAIHLPGILRTAWTLSLVLALARVLHPGRVFCPPGTLHAPRAPASSSCPCFSNSSRSGTSLWPSILSSCDSPCSLSFSCSSICPPETLPFSSSSLFCLRPLLS